MKYRIIKRKKKSNYELHRKGTLVNLNYDNFLSSYFINDKNELKKVINESLILF